MDGSQAAACKVLVNAVLVYEFITVGLSVTEHIVQMIAFCSIVPLVHNLRENGLRFSRSVLAFFAWWVLTAAFIVVVSSLDMAQLSSTHGTWLYYMGMAFCMVGINTLFALDFDLYPIETEQGEVVENVDAYMDKLYGDLAQRMEEAMTKEHKK